MLENITYEYCAVDNKLINYIESTPSLHMFFKKDWENLKAKQYCGIINYDGEDFYILPKISKDNDEENLNIFIYMLM